MTITRRNFLKGLGSLGISIAAAELGLLSGCLSERQNMQSSASGLSEPMFRANPQRTGLYNTKGVSQPAGLKWKFKTEKSLWSTPAISEGIAYFGSNDTYLYAVDAKSGKEAWKFKTEHIVDSSPAVADGMVYFGCEDNYLYAVGRTSFI